MPPPQKPSFVDFRGEPAQVGKSSVINALRAKAVCKVAPVPGETKVWQYVTLTRRVNLIDCPGVVYDDPKAAKDQSDDADAVAVLKGIVRAERLPDPMLFIAPLLKRCEAKHVVAAYEVEFEGLPGGDGDQAATEAFVERLARKSGRLRKGGEPDTRTVAVQLINDWQRGRLPHFVAPPCLPRPEAEAEQPEAAADASAPEDSDDGGD